MRSPARRLVLALLAATALPAWAAERPHPYPGYVSATYADPATWVCRPDTADACDQEMDATQVKANGKVRLERWKAAKKPKIDCFYVYPTISSDPGGNSDFVPGENEEIFVARQQAARLGSVCRVFAPVYRSVTLTALLAALGGSPIPMDSDLADADLLDAWKHYVANDNGGRGVVLIGHSQGAGRLVTLIRNEIDGNADLRARLVSAILLGTSLQVPEGGDVGGDFANVPLCRSPRDTACAISFSSFRADAPPPPNSFFGRSLEPGMKAACTNPAALGGGRGTLHPYFPTDGATLPIVTVPPPDWVDPAEDVAIETPFVALPRFIDAECAEANGFVYLSLFVNGDPDDPRIDDVRGDLTPEWGLHLIDANVAMGDFVSIVKRQAKAHRRKR